ncbi:Crp/Fnr family transcriptional regulator [Cohnella sp. AR92]|uniref:Crp/Fnr family transcriptional regulator n=1 Tax=Cohnella sp. AR92 TaxID=648716 RepID=UPI000F8D80D9|nr:Crp/Fnr family transcriptional regulator [Cohnella sp. AR92]RUS48994.1 Crp/Fnr family transcriptional regulator [Cohnella sp. AR92]
MRQLEDKERLEGYLRQFELEKVFPPELRKHLTLYRFEPDEALCRQGEEPQQVFLIVHGKVRIYTTSAEGRTLLVNFTTPLGLIGEIEYLQEGENLNTVTAVTPVEAIGIHKQRLRPFNGEVPLLQFLLDQVSRKFYTKSIALSSHLLHPVEVRFASYLLSVSSDEEAGAADRISLTDMKDIAGLIGTSYRHLNRVIQGFAASGLVERRHGTLIVKDRTGLTAMAGGNIYEREGREGS